MTYLSHCICCRQCFWVFFNQYLNISKLPKPFFSFLFWEDVNRKTLRQISFCVQLSKQLSIKIWKQNEYWLLNMSVMDGIWGNSKSYVHDCDDNSYFNIDGKHFHTEICIEKRKLIIKDVCKVKNVNDILKVTCQLWSTLTAFVFKFVCWEELIRWVEIKLSRRIIYKKLHRPVGKALCC